MLKKIGKAIVNNIGLKILSIALAVVLWLIVVNIDDPTISKNFTVPVTIENAEYLTDMGEYFEVMDDTKNVVFSVSGKRSYIEKLTGNDFKAVANMEKIDISEDLKTGTIPVEITAVRYANQLSVSKIPRYINVKLDDLANSQYMITPVTAGEPAEGCIVGKLSVSPNLIKLSGPKSELSKVHHVEAVINVTDMSSDVTGTVIPTLVDKDGNVIESANIKKSVDSVTVSAQILGTKEVGIVTGYTGTPADGYQFDSLVITPQTVMIQGTALGLNQVTNIAIPDYAVDITGASDKIIQTIDVNAYLPEGVTVYGGDSKVRIEVSIARVETKVIDVPVSRINVIGLGEGLDIVFAEETIPVRVTGIEREIDVITANDLELNLDVSGQVVGRHANRLGVRGVSTLTISSGIISYSIESIDNGVEPDDDGQEEVDEVTDGDAENDDSEPVDDGEDAIIGGEENDI